MPFVKGYIPTEEHKQKIREALKKKGIKPKLRFNNKGIPMSEEQKKKISDKLKGHKVSSETRKKIGQSNKGNKNHIIPHREETKEIISNAKIDTKLGKENPFYKSGLYTKEKRKYLHYTTSFRYKKWRKAVFERDGYKCIRCGKKGYLQAHHIKIWTKYPALRYIINNGESLCLQCHKDTHRAKR